VIKMLNISPADRLNLAWKPIVEDLEFRKLMGADTVQAVPFLLDFGSTRGELVDKDGQGTGFTRTQTNSNAAASYVANLIDLDTGAGVLRLTTTGNASAGGNSGSDNSLVNALETQFDGTTSGFTIEARLKGPLNYLNDPFEQGGIYFGPDQDNFVKLVAIRTANGNFLQFRDEQSTATGTTSALPSGSLAQEVPIGSFSSINTLDVRMVGDAASGRVTAFYSVNGAAFTKITGELTLSGSKRTAFFIATSRAGIMAFHKNNVGPITVTFDSFQISGGQSTAGRPSVTGTRPANGETNVSRDIFVAGDLNLPNVGGGVDVSTLNTNSVRLVRTSDGQLIPGSVDTTGGGDAIVYQPSTPLAASTSYTFIVTDLVKDTTGAAFVPFTATFTTGTSGGQVDSSIAFERIMLPTTFGSAWTGLTEGPDGKLYATTIDGKIVRFGFNSDGTLGSGQVINTIIDGEGGPRMTLSIAFAPDSTAGNLVAYVSHGQYAGLPGLPLATNFTGKITKLSGANLQTRQDIVIGLPRSVKDHQNYQAVFGPDGKLYVNVASLSALGAPDNAWGLKDEVLLSGAMLQIDVNAIGTQTINVRTDGASPYNPFASGAPVKIYARGLRSAYDILFHSNGSHYSATNGSAAGGNTPAKPGVSGTGLNNVATQDDYLFEIDQNGYYGAPNPTRGEYILNGGNPTSGFDPGEIGTTQERPAAYPVGTPPEASYKGFEYNFGKNYSANGLIEYKGNAFNGALAGKILIVRYSGGDDILVMTPNSNGSIASVNAGYQGLSGFVDPLDLVQNSTTGFLYVAEYGGQRITLLRPITPGGGNADIQKTKYFFNDVINNSSTTTGNRQKVMITNNGTGTLSISQLLLSGADAGSFSIVNNPGTLTIAAGQSAEVTVAFAAGSVGVKTATLTVVSNDAETPNLALTLRGLGTAGEGGNLEPSLQRVMDLFFGSGVYNVGDSNPNDTAFTTPPGAGNDEVLLQRLQKAGSGSVTVELLANFANSVSPSSRFGWYDPGTVAAFNKLFDVGVADAQSVNPVAQGTTTFDPGNANFGLYAQFPAFTDRAVYSEDSLNRWEPNASNRRKVRFYPLKNADGSVVPNAYVFTFEEFQLAYDQNDVIGIIRNVKAAPGGAEIGVENRDGMFTFPNRLVFNRITTLDLDLPNAFHERATLRINNTGSAALNISGMSVSSSDWVIESGGGAQAVSAGGFIDVVVRFVYNRAANGNEIRNGTLTINSNDADEPAKTVQLSGIAQSHSEDAPSFGSAEPTAQTVIDAYGYNVKITNTGQSINTLGNRTRVGEEVLSEYWQRAETGLPVTVRQLAAFHQQSIITNSVIKWFYQQATAPSSSTTIFKHLALDGQSLFPRLDSTAANPTAPAQGTFAPNTNAFGFKVDANYSVQSFNTNTFDAGHSMRFYQAKDQSGNVIPNTYILAHDYVGISFSNYDYQDNIYIVSNVKPLTAPSTLTGLSGTGSGAGNLIKWTKAPEGNVSGYNVYRSNSATGTFTKVNASPVTDVQFNDILAPGNATSFYRVTAVSYHGAESTAATTSAFRPNDTVAPAAPSNLTGQGTASGITLLWNDNTETDLAGYNIYRSSSAGGTFTKLNTSGLRSVSDFTDTTAPVGATSFYRVSAVDGSGNESTFATLSAFRPASGSTPASASNAVATAQTGSTVLLTWNDNSSNEFGFRIERRLQSNQSWATVGTGDINQASFTDTTAAPGTAYAYRVIVYNSFGDGASSNESNVTTPGSGTTAPSNLAAIASSQSVIDLTWFDNSGDETGFRIERRQGSGAWATIDTTAADATSYSASGLLEGTSYSFQVISLGAAGDSAPSNEATAATQSQFTSNDIGNPTPGGSTQTIATGRDYNVIAGGGDIWGNADSFRFAYKQITGDFDISVLVAGIDATHATAPAGLMARASIASSSANVIQRTDASSRFRFAYRTTTGGTTTAMGTAVGTAGATWLRLARVGNTFTGFSSSDGVTWTQTGTITLNLGGTVFVGLAASSKNVAATTTARFRNFNDGSTPLPAAPNAPSALNADGATLGQVTLNWADNSTNETGFRIERKTGGGSYSTMTTVAADATSFVDTTVADGTTYTYRVIAVGASIDSAPSNEATVTTQSPAVPDSSTSSDIAATPTGTTNVISANKDYDITAGGLDVVNNSDSFRFVHFAESGDFDTSVRVDNLTGPSGQNPQAGLMARDGLAANARHVNIRLDQDSVMMKWRSSTGGTTAFSSKVSGLTGPIYLRLRRVGNVFTGFYSTNGTTWIQVGTITLSLPPALRVGMTLLSKTNSETATAQFRDFTLN